MSPWLPWAFTCSLLYLLSDNGVSLCWGQGTVRNHRLEVLELCGRQSQPQQDKACTARTLMSQSRFHERPREVLAEHLDLCHMPPSDLSPNSSRHFQKEEKACSRRERVFPRLVNRARKTVMNLTPKIKRYRNLSSSWMQRRLFSCLFELLHWEYLGFVSDFIGFLLYLIISFLLLGCSGFKFHSWKLRTVWPFFPVKQSSPFLEPRFIGIHAEKKL